MLMHLSGSVDWFTNQLGSGIDIVIEFSLIKDKWNRTIGKVISDENDENSQRVF